MKKQKQTKDIYIIKNDINNKVYIGQTNNPEQRWRQYKSAVKTRPNAQVITKAMRKYGIEHFYMEILEKNVIDYDEREKYNIKKYNSIVPNGYNITIGGSGCGSGVNHPSSKIKTESELNELIDEIIQNEVSLKSLSQKYNMSYTQIEAINTGRAYFNKELEYPLRSSQRYSEEKVKQITYSLKYELDKSLVQIAKEYNIDHSYLNDLNQGRAWHRDYIKYPIRVGKMKRAEDYIPKIQQLLLTSEISQRDIAKQFNISAQTVCQINLGKTGHNAKYTYPLRTNTNGKYERTCISPDQLDYIINLLKNSSMSMNKISIEVEVPAATIRGINDGSIKKYRNEHYTYPIRKKR